MKNQPATWLSSQKARTPKTYPTCNNEVPDNSKFFWELFGSADVLNFPVGKLNRGNKRFQLEYQYCHDFTKNRFYTFQHKKLIDTHEREDYFSI
jgi:hypothetical protein